MRINIPPIVLLITCGIVGPGLTFANEDGETPPFSVKMVDVTCFRDGGTTGFETQVDGHKELFCLDGRMVPASDQSYMWHVYLNATHPSTKGAIKVPIGGKEEARIIAILSIWIDSELSKSMQEEFLQGSAPKATSEATKLWWALKVKKILESRQKTLNHSFQPTGHTTARR